MSTNPNSQNQISDEARAACSRIKATGDYYANGTPRAEAQMIRHALLRAADEIARKHKLHSPQREAEMEMIRRNIGNVINF